MNENSVALTDLRSDETCLVNHQRDMACRDQAAPLAKALPRNI